MAFAVLGTSFQASAQGPCSITIGPDVTICQGQSTTLLGPPGWSSYLWSNGATTQNITVGTAGNYWCQVGYPSGQLVTNGNFDDAGNTGFSTQFNYNSNLQVDGNYYLGYNAGTYHPFFVGWGSGLFLIGNGGLAQSGWDIWCQTVPVCPGQTYTLAFDLASMVVQNPPHVRWRVNGTLIGPTFIPPAGPNVWVNNVTNWTAPAGVTSAAICLELTSSFSVGNDFGIDNIGMSGNMVLRDTVQVNVTPLPAVNLGPDQVNCGNNPVNLNAAVPGGTYLWSTGATTPAISASTNGNYSVTVTANGCSNNDAVQLTFLQAPSVNLGNDTTICAGHSVTLNATYPGATYLWSTGATTPTIAVGSSGNYGVTVTLNGCTANDSRVVTVNPLPTLDLGNDTTVCAGNSVTFNATVPGASYLWSTGATTPTLSASSTGNYSATVTLNGCAVTDDVDLTVAPNPTVDLRDTTLCAGQPLTLSAAFPGASYLWSTGATTATINAAAGGNFSVTVDLNGCTASDANVVTVNPLPTFDLGNDTTVCAGNSVTFNAAVPGASYLWSTGATTPTLSASSTGNYSATVTLNGCSVTDDVDLTVAPNPTVDLRDTTICAGQPLTLSAAFPGASYLWSTGATTATINAAAGGNFSVTVDLNGCTASDANVVTVNPLPAFDLGNDTIVCPGQAVTFNATVPGASYLWQDGSNTASYTTATPGNYAVTVSLAGCSASDGVTLTNFSLQSVNLGPDVTACAGSPVPLAVNVPGATYLWSTGATSNAINASSSGTYWVRTILNGCQASDTVQVTFIALPVVALGNDTTVCPGTQVQLDATTAGASYLWNNGSSSATINAGAGNWSVQVTVNGCTGSDDLVIATHTPPTVALGNDTTLCPGATLVLNASVPGGTYLWQNGTTASSFVVSAAGNYSVTVTDANTCAASDAISVSYAAPVPVFLGNDTTLCAGATLTLNTAVPGASYLWSTGATTPSIAVSTAGAYSVSVTQGSCAVADAINVGTVAPPSVFLGNDTTLCPGATLALNATQAGVSYLWQDGSTTATFTVQSPGAYSVALTDANGCSGGDQIDVLYASPNAVDLGPDQAVCQGTTVTLDATLPGSTYLWSTGSTAATISVANAGTYAVEVMQGACSVTDTVVITTLSVPVVDLGNDTTLCPGGSITLDASWPGAQYSWSTGATASSVVVSTSGPAWVAVSANGCSASDTVLVTVLGTLAIDLGSDTAFCPGASLLLTAQLPGGTTTWSDGTQGPVFTVQQPGTYWATVDVGGCAASDTISVTSVTLADIDLGLDLSLCAGTTQLLDATTTPGAAYLWDDGSTAVTRTVSTAGTYWAQATLAGCSVTDSITVSIVPLPVVDLGNDTALCLGATITLDATTPGASYLWNNGATAASVSALPGAWSVQVTVSGCAASDSLTIGTLASPTVDLGNDTTLCDGASMVLDATFAGATYTWQNGSTTATFNVGQAGNYSVVVDLNGCTASDAIGVAYYTPVNVDLGPDTMLCPGTTIGWNFSAPGAAYLWSDGSTTGQYSTGSAGTVWLVAGAPGCLESDTVNVGMTPLPQPDLGQDLTACAGDTIDLAVAAGQAQVLWSTGSTQPAITATSTGTYGVTLSLDGCTSSDAIAITFLPIVDQVDLGGELTICPGQELVLDAFVPGATYLWSTGSSDARITVMQPGIYVVMGVGPCIAFEDTVLLTDGGCAPDVHVPNGFTPNGDGINDVFGPVVYGRFVTYEFAVFDRWGERIFTTDQPGLPWDGSYNGTAVQDGVYVWTLRYKALGEDGVTQERLTGHVTLLR